MKSKDRSLCLHSHTFCNASLQKVPKAGMAMSKHHYQIGVRLVCIARNARAYPWRIYHIGLIRRKLMVAGKPMDTLQSRP